MLTPVCDHHGMSDTSAERTTRLLLAKLSYGMSLAADSLYLAMPSAPDSPNDVGFRFSMMREHLAELEAATCALMLHSGASWDVLAAHYGVSRQALHRRLASRVDEFMESAQANPDDHRSKFEKSLGFVLDTIGRFESSPDENLTGATEQWQERKKTPTWWYGRRRPSSPG